MKINDTNTTVKIGQCYNGDIITIDNDGTFKCGDAVVHSVKVNTAKPKVYVTSKPETIDYTCNISHTINTKKDFENMFDKIKDYKVYEKTTVVFFSDGTKEAVVCCDEDTFDVEQGITMCVIKRMFGDKYKKSVKSIIKAKTLNEKNVKKLEEAHKEAQLREERKEKRNRENKLRMKARYEARLAAAIEEEKKKLKGKKILNESKF